MLFLAAVTASAFRAQPNAFEAFGGWFRYFWYVTYEFGYVRRALLGALAAPFIDAADPAAFINAATLVFNAAALCAAALLLLFALHRLPRPAFFCTLGFFLVSPLLPYLIIYPGIPDNIIIAVCICATLAILSGRIVVFMALLLAGMQVHEMAGLILLPVALCVAWFGRTRAQRAAFPAALAGFVICLFAAAISPAAVQFIDVFGQYGMTPDFGSKVLAYLNKSSLANFYDMAYFWEDNLPMTAAGCLYPLLAILPLWFCAVPGQGHAGGPRRLGLPELAGFAAAFTFPYFAVLVGYDYSRYAALATLGNCLVLVCFFCLHAPPREKAASVPGKTPLALFAAAVFLYCAMPLYWFWPNGLIPVNLGYHKALHNPLAAAMERRGFLKDANVTDLVFMRVQRQADRILEEDYAPLKKANGVEN